MRAFITGIEGFAGHYLAGELASAGWEVSGSFYEQGPARDLGLPALCRVDLASGQGLKQALDGSGPDVIFHLAAQSSAALAFKDPRLTFEVNVLGTVNLLEASRSLPEKPRVVLISSCEVYGPNPDESPHDESRPLNPRSPYAASKAAQELAGLSFAHSYGLEMVIARPFPHLGPGQSDNFALPSFARQIAEIEAGRREPVVKVGNLEARRDFTDVRDVVRAYRLLGDQGRPGEFYNVCTGRAVSVGEALKAMLGMSRAAIKVELDPGRLRPSDTPLLLGENRKIREATGWSPGHGIEESLGNLLGHWRKKIADK